MTARDELYELVGAYRARLSRGGPPLRADELDALHVLLGAAQREDEALPPPRPASVQSAGDMLVFYSSDPPREPLPSWRALEAEFGPIEPESVEPEPEPPSTRSLDDLTSKEMRQLRREAQEHIRTGGEPSIRGMAKRLNISQRAVRNVIDDVQNRR